MEISVEIIDPSGVYDDNTDTLGQGAYIVIDTTCEFSESSILAVVQLELESDDTYKAIIPYAVRSLLHEDITFCYRAYAYDNDFDCGNPLDRTLSISDIQECIIYNNLPPKLTVISPNDNEVYSCECGDQKVSFMLEDSEGIKLDEMVIEVNGIEYSYPDNFVSEGDFDSIYVEWFVPDSICFEHGDLVNVKLWGFADRFGNYPPEDSIFWSFIIDQRPPVVVYPDSLDTMLFVEQFTSVAIFVSDDFGEIDESSIEVEIQISKNVNGIGVRETPLIFTSEPAVLYNSSVDTLYIDFSSMGIRPDIRDSVFISINNICDNAIGCGANCFETLVPWVKFLKFDTKCMSHPMPFTPNGDGVNDLVKIDYPDRFDNLAEIRIYDLQGSEINLITVGSSAHMYEWDGRDKNGIACRQGVYVFVVEVEGEVVCTGTIVLAR